MIVTHFHTAMPLFNDWKSILSRCVCVFHFSGSSDYDTFYERLRIHFSPVRNRRFHSMHQLPWMIKHPAEECCLNCGFILTHCEMVRCTFGTFSHCTETLLRQANRRTSDNHSTNRWDVLHAVVTPNAIEPKMPPNRIRKMRHFESPKAKLIECKINVGTFGRSQDKMVASSADILRSI